MKKIVRPKHVTDTFTTNTFKYSANKPMPVSLDNLVSNEKEIIEAKIKEIESKIEEMGKVCDRKKQKSYEDYNNVLKSNKAQYLDELTKLNFKLIEVIKQNTREDFLNKLRKDLRLIKNQVYDKDKELQKTNFNLLQEEKQFTSKEITNAKQYNLYLINKLKELENNSAILNNSNNAITRVNKDQSLNNSTSLMPTTNISPRTKEKDIEKVARYFKRTEDLLMHKISNEEKIQKERYSKYKAIETFKNPILRLLQSKVKGYHLRQINEKVTNQEIFFNNSEHELTKKNLPKKNILRKSRSISYEPGLTRAEKKDIIKNFFEDIALKKYIFEFLYD